MGLCPGSLHCRRLGRRPERSGDRVDDAHGQRTPDGSDWELSRAQLEEMFGPVAARTEFDAEWSVLGGPGMAPVRDSEVKALLVARRRANALSAELGAAFASRGFGPELLPQMSGRVDARGCPIVIIGGASEETAVRLIDFLRAGQSPEAIRPAWDGPGSEGLVIGVELDGREAV